MSIATIAPRADIITQAACGPLTDEEARHLVALHAAATLLPESASVTTRERTRARWFAALKPTLDTDPDWAVVYLPGVHCGDNDTYAVHKDTGRVFGDCSATTLARGESTAEWLARLAHLV